MRRFRQPCACAKYHPRCAACAGPSVRIHPKVHLRLAQLKIIHYLEVILFVFSHHLPPSTTNTITQTHPTPTHNGSIKSLSDVPGKEIVSNFKFRFNNCRGPGNIKITIVKYEGAFSGRDTVLIFAVVKVNRSSQCSNDIRPHYLY